jgi:hypothetical protein
LSTNLLEHLNEEVKCRIRVVGIFPSDAAFTRLVDAVLLEQDRHWQLEARRMFSSESMAASPALDTLQLQVSLQGAAYDPGSGINKYAIKTTVKELTTHQPREKGLTSQSLEFIISARVASRE